ncbi:CHAT domain-containing protein [Truncatella angustata]|uniref:CHAT domain-containing protein n=1 Tax=Truncatella angustata TaxID=152316 RepID=A0A9P8RIU7_9PEZI|nr:CHAT domain-containing protein [Truncatella angustata]KAH6646649.1 CHAT domain-containing protein [Truncatella angustata]
MMSSVALADGEELTVGELLGRRLKTYLVVLSACDTGIGQLTDGDDVMGFSRSLLAAGVKNIVVSLWPVHDLATSFLMKRFYEQLQKGQRVSAALREAQNVVKQLKPDEMDRYVVELRKECGEDTFARSIAPEKENPWQHKVYSQPRFWAPFIFIGLR